MSLTSDAAIRLLYINNLKTHVVQYLTILESIFGPRDSRFIFNTIGQSCDEQPCTYFPSQFHFDGNCPVDILIGKWPWEHYSPDQGPWQIAHECVHLLDPGVLGSANVLEEGLATWFQNEPRYHNKEVQRYIARQQNRDPCYANAEKLVRSTLPGIFPAVNTLRIRGIRIRDIQTDMLIPLLPNIEKTILDCLCAQF